jgi:hypothetical protein
MKAISHDKWEWFGVVGHYICGQWCRFHLATMVGPWLVSTIGEYVHPLHSKGNEKDEAEWMRVNWPGEDIGCGRKYETMVFKAGARCTKKGCECNMPAIGGSELDIHGYQTRGQAQAGHLQMCKKWSRKASVR